ncbi:glycerophosphodiester phosphodiesterase family protein [Larkinella soli]|uniref:glycerophosphodiester phosphodiesterase family protein n=1 Tax=Larkinella soli TaxID=1770527 RepID=UPI000FFC5E25|nr:glycerophosphodiester phosphodiesterase family protein [Larkinella soli]
MKKTLLTVFMLAALLPATAQKARPFARPEAIDQVLRHDPARTVPLILAHRGGPQAHETENSLETFRNTFRQVPEAILEMDVRMTADSVLMLLHDDDIARTTTGTGSVQAMPWEELKTVFLRDLKGRPTRQRIPRFEEVLAWGAGRVLMAIDAKPGVDLRKVMNLIAAEGALNSVFIICYSTEDALAIQKRFPTVWVALGFNQADHTETLRKAGLAIRNVIALASRQKKEFYESLHRYGISVTAGTYGPGNLDEQPVEAVAEDYRTVFRTGADILTTDRPVEVRRLFP